jgi:hypothetical protein
MGQIMPALEMLEKAVTFFAKLTLMGQRPGNTITNFSSALKGRDISRPGAPFFTPSPETPPA